MYKKFCKNTLNLSGSWEKKKIRDLTHASVELVDLEFLDQKPHVPLDWDRFFLEYFLVSNDGLLLLEHKQHSTKFFSRSAWFSEPQESVFSAAKRVGMQNIAYVAEIRRDHIIIHKPEGKKTFMEHLQSLINKMEHELDV